MLLPDWLQLLETGLLKEPIEWKLQWMRLSHHQHWDGGRMTTARPPEVFCVLAGLSQTQSWVLRVITQSCIQLGPGKKKRLPGIRTLAQLDFLLHVLGHLPLLLTAPTEKPDFSVELTDSNSTKTKPLKSSQAVYLKVLPCIKTENQQGPIVLHSEFCSVFCNNLNGKRIGKE